MTLVEYYKQLISKETRLLKEKHEKELLESETSENAANDKISELRNQLSQERNLVEQLRTEISAVKKSHIDQSVETSPFSLNSLATKEQFVETDPQRLVSETVNQATETFKQSTQDQMVNTEPMLTPQNKIVQTKETNQSWTDTIKQFMDSLSAQEKLVRIQTNEIHNRDSKINLLEEELRKAKEVELGSLSKKLKATLDQLSREQALKKDLERKIGAQMSRSQDNHAAELIEQQIRRLCTQFKITIDREPVLVMMAKLDVALGEIISKQIQLEQTSQLMQDRISILERNLNQELNITSSRDKKIQTLLVEIESLNEIISQLKSQIDQYFVLI